MHPAIKHRRLVNDRIDAESRFLQLRDFCIAQAMAFIGVRHNMTSVLVWPECALQMRLEAVQVCINVGTLLSERRLLPNFGRATQDPARRLTVGLAVRQIAHDRRACGEAFEPGAQGGQRREIGQGCPSEISVAWPCGGGRGSTHASSLGRP